ncbi:MAG: PhzF family phenazine biosynthesis protein [Terriglobales bacterium]
MGETIVQVDAFAARPFGGNPAAVCFLEQPREAAWMQNVAREMNLSETAFLEPRLGAEGRFGLRWFTPAVEVALCGHATLASAHAIWEEGRAPRGAILRFQTKSGELTAAAREDWIEMDFPAKPEQAAAAPDGLEAALGIRPQYVGRNQFDFLVELESEAAVRDLRPNHTALRQLAVRGVMVTSRAQPGEFDFVSRFFAPGSGIDEDPVTGSAHCCLAPFWAKRLGKTEMLAYQASPRGGVVRLGVRGARVKLAGQAVTVMRGALA